MEKMIIIVELNNDDFNEKFLEGSPSWFKRTFCKFYRGFSVGAVIYLRKNVKVGRLKLIAHEMGHIYDKKHTPLPTIMNPYWVFRWF